ncbi:MAG: hydroxymethylbilane synthase [Chloroflexi bacterium]|nr:hydroxymethylbilane synthase [Chloroflexota bacterium]
MSGRSFRIGSRGSKLALWQAQAVQARLVERFPQHRFELVVISTRGDEQQTVPLASLGEGVFVKALETALVEERVDFAVHSLKDVPVLPGEYAEALVLAAFPERADPRDVLISPAGLPLHQLPPDARVATGSPRRAAQLLALRPDLRMAEVRGNLDTRLRKLREQGLDGLVLAAAGLARLGLLGVVTQYFEPEQVTPAVGQGALAVQCRAADTASRAVAVAIDSAALRLEVSAERAVLAALGGGCRVPVGALARVAGEHLTLLGALGREDGRGIVRLTEQGLLAQAEQLGQRLAARLRAEC